GSNSGNPARIIDFSNTRLSLGNRYGIVYNTGTGIYGESISASALVSTSPYLGVHWGWLNTNGNNGTLMFALDGETPLTTSIGLVTPGYNNSYCAIGGNRDRYSRM